jgi:DNA-binding FadR family transcriptional regulator
MKNSSGVISLAVNHGVSRTVVREASKTLVQNGLAEVRTGEDTFVTNDTSQAFRHSLILMMSLSESDRLAEMVEIRELLEPQIAARAAERAEADDLQRLEEAIGEMERNLDSSADFIAADNRFLWKISPFRHRQRLYGSLGNYAGVN